MSKVVDCVQALVQSLAEQCGYEVVEIDYSKNIGGYYLTVYIDKEGGVDINDCVALHRLLDEPLDKLNPTNDQPYFLSVQSCGVDRPLKKQKDFERNVGKKVELKFFVKVDNRKSVCGIISSADDNGVTIQVDNEEINFEYKQIASANLVFEDKGVL